MKRINIFTVELIKENGKLYDLEDAIVKSPDHAYDIIEKVFNLSAKPKEYFGMLSLSTKNKVMGAHIIHIGSVNASIVSARDVFQQALLNNATSIIVFHNHPSGNTNPSPEDIDVTKRLVNAGDVLGITVVDHLIIGHNEYLSLKTKGYM